MRWNLSPLCRFGKQSRRQPIRNTFRPLVEQLESRLTPANVPVLSGHYDNLLSGWNNQETALTPTNVNDAGFGKLFNYTVDGYVCAQPLYVPTRPTPARGPHNVVFAATEHDSLFAFDADTPTPATGGGLLWQTSYLVPRTGFTVTTMPSGETLSGDIVPEVGITGT